MQEKFVPNQHSSFSHLGNSGNSYNSVKGKGLISVKIYIERKVL